MFVDAIVVGSGLSGVVAAQQLSQSGKRCLILEAGRRLQNSPTLDDLTLDPTLWSYETEGVPFHWDRVRLAGGRSLIWGGWCAEPEEQNFRDAEEFASPWPLQFSELIPYLHEARALLNPVTHELTPFYGNIAQQLQQQLGLTLAPKTAAMADAKRAVSGMDLLGLTTLRPGCLVKELLIGADGGVGGVGYIDMKTGAAKEATAPLVFLAASPIENARLLLGSPQLHDKIPLSQVGRGLTDHLVGSYLLVNPSGVAVDDTSCVAAAAWIRRFVNVDHSSRRDYTGGFIVEVSGPSRLQDINGEILQKLALHDVDAERATAHMLHLIGEAAPAADRYVTVHPTKRDRLGRALPQIHWGEHDNDNKMAADMSHTARALAEILGEDGSQLICFHEPHLPGGVAHEAGTCRMGVSPDAAVTDPFGAVYGMPGLYLVDASLMPTALDRYPTMTVLALTLRTVQAAMRRNRRS